MDLYCARMCWPTLLRRKNEEPEETEMVAMQLTPKEQLGKFLFFDANLSTPPGQACATCHGPAAGFTGPDSSVNETTVVYPGALEPRFRNRKPPAASYASASSKLHIEEEELKQPPFRAFSPLVMSIVPRKY